MTYSIDYQKKRKYFYRFLIIIFLVDFGIALIIGNKDQLDDNKLLSLLIGLLGFTFVFYLFPLIIIYFNYLNRNKNYVLTVVNDSKMIYTDKRNRKEFLISDVKCLEMHLSKTVFENRMRWFFWDELFYYKVLLKKGDILIISCLLSDNIHQYFSKSQIKKVKRLFPIIKTEKTVKS